jgi:hypothetical protein
MKRLLLALLCIAPIQAETFEINSHAFRFPSTGEMVMLWDSEKGFIAVRDNMVQVVPDYNCDEALRNITMEHLQRILNHGYIKINEADDGQLSLRYYACLKGGGPLLSQIFYWGTKSILWGTLIGTATAATTGVVVATGGAASIPVATAIAGCKAAAVGGIAGVAATTVSTAITTTAVGASVGTATAGVMGGAVAGGATAAGLVGTIETASAFMGAIGFWIPWL